jgi:hypothetical protein
MDHIQDFVLKKKDYLLAQVGNPEGSDKPNKKVILASGGMGTWLITALVL